MQKVGYNIIIYISLIFSLNLDYIWADIQKDVIEKLLKLSKKLRINTYRSGKCVSKRAIKKIIKKLNSNSIKKRNMAYTVLKDILHCRRVKVYIEKHVAKMSTTAKYLILNAVTEVGIEINLPFIKHPTSSNSTDPSKRAIEATRRYYYDYYSKTDIFSYLNNCGIQNNQNQIVISPNITISNNNYPSVECNRIFIQKDFLQPSELLDLLFKCLYKYVENYKNILYKTNKYHIFKRNLLALFKKSVADIAIIYLSKYHDIMKDIEKQEGPTQYSGKYSWSSQEKFLYIEAVLLYFFTHILNKGELLSNILNTVSNDDFTLAIFLSFPLIKSKYTHQHINTIIVKLTAQRIQKSEYLLQGFLCIYSYFSRVCKNFKRIDFSSVNPITDYDKVVNAMKKCDK